MSSKRVTIVADELLGHVRTGGLGTAASFLALALARMGHRVDVLYLGPMSERDDSWSRRFAESGVRIRPLERSGQPVEPAYFAQMRDVERALQAHQPEVVVTQDLAAPTDTALRMRRLGLAFPDTRFVVNCYGTRRWITDMSAKARVLPGAHAVTMLERASLELADAVVSPSRYLVDWMREQRWQLPQQTFVIPYYTLSAATGDATPTERPPETGHVRRLAFFGRIEERKGIAPFLQALNLVEPRLLDALEVAFVGKVTPAWPPERIEGLLSGDVKNALGSITFETDLDQPEAIASLRQPGTLAVLPSFGESFGNAVRECLDHGIPFLASDAGAVPELIAREDWERTLFPPTSAGIAEALRRRLTSDDPLLPARTVLDDAKLDEHWTDVLAAETPPHATPAADPFVDVVLVDRGSERSMSRCLSALAEQTYRLFRVLVVNATGRIETPPGPREALPFELHRLDAAASDVPSARSAAFAALHAEWVVFLDQEDVPSPRFLETLVRAQASSGADVVSCGAEVDAGGDRLVWLFLGDPGGLGVLSNAYGTAALVRRALLAPDERSRRAPRDPDWPLLAGISASGGRVVSVPAPLVTRSARPGAIEDDPVGAFAVLHELEHALPRALEGLARVAAGLAADVATTPAADDPRGPGLGRRVRRRLSTWGVRR